MTRLSQSIEALSNESVKGFNFYHFSNFSKQWSISLFSIFSKHWSSTTTFLGAVEHWFLEKCWLHFLAVRHFSLNTKGFLCFVLKYWSIEALCCESKSSIKTHSEVKNVCFEQYFHGRSLRDDKRSQNQRKHQAIKFENNQRNYSIYRNWILEKISRMIAARW